jgi:hypothetical protein
MEESIPFELVVDCNTAILFLPISKMTDPPEATEEAGFELCPRWSGKIEEHSAQLSSIPVSVTVFQKTTIN